MQAVMRVVRNGERFGTPPHEVYKEPGFRGPVVEFYEPLVLHPGKKITPGGFLGKVHVRDILASREVALTNGLKIGNARFSKVAAKELVEQLELKFPNLAFSVRLEQMAKKRIPEAAKALEQMLAEVTSANIHVPGPRL